jgi:hypothetical protein
MFHVEQAALAPLMFHVERVARLGMINARSVAFAVPIEPDL